MLRKLPRLTLLLALGIVGASCSIVAQPLAGCWTNELGSTANITVDEHGTLRGKYTSAVSSGETPVEGDLIGIQGSIDKPTFGFMVKWTTESVTVWTGQMFDGEGKQTLKTTWLLRSRSRAHCNWVATQTGMDVFTRCNEKCGSRDGDGGDGNCDPSEEGS